MSDFDRELAKCIGSAASKTGAISRDLVASCYKNISLLFGAVESNEVSEKWIDFLVDRLSDLRIEKRGSEQIAKGVFEKIAKA